DKSCERTTGRASVRTFYRRERSLQLRVEIVRRSNRQIEAGYHCTKIVDLGRGRAGYRKVEDEDVRIRRLRWSRVCDSREIILHADVAQCLVNRRVSDLVKFCAADVVDEDVILNRISKLNWRLKGNEITGSANIALFTRD